MKIYLSGPMRGHKLHNFPAFFSASLALKKLGHQVVNPAERDMAQGLDPTNGDLESQGIDIGALFEFDFQAILDTDAMVLLPGWESSSGAQAERVVAHFTRRKVFEYDPTSPSLLRPSAPYLEPEIVWREAPRVDSGD